MQQPNPKREPMRTLADVKRAMQVGTRWHFRADWCPTATIIRTVVKVQTNGVGFTSLRPGSDGPSWLYWPKASSVTVAGDRVTVADEHMASAWLEYTRVDEAHDELRKERARREAKQGADRMRAAKEAAEQMGDAS